MCYCFIFSLDKTGSGNNEELSVGISFDMVDLKIMLLYDFI